MLSRQTQVSLVILIQSVWALSKALSLDVAYFWTTYSDYTKENPRGLDGAMASMDKDVYSRTNKVFGVSVNYKF